MNRINLIISTFLLFTFPAFSQHYSIQSNVFDQKNGAAIEVATVRLLNASDSAFVQATQTDSKGRFSLNKLASGNYILNVNFLGYHQHSQNVAITNKDVILKNIQLQEDSKLLSEVVVKGTAVQMTVKGDTLEYNATAYKTQENAAVEDLLKKLPGVEVDNEGKITVNGEEIKNIRVDGKKFFSGDIEQAVKNLPADMIDKIQVLDQKSDMAQLTGFEDSDTERIINLTTKSNRRRGVFGNVGAGAGADMEVFDKGHEFSMPDDFRYEGNASVNIMNGNSQTTINAGANNLNNARGGRGRGSWGGNTGITSTQNIGLNNNSIINPSLKLGGDVTGNHSENLNISDSYREEYTKGDTIFSTSKNNSISDRYNVNVRFETEWNIDSLNTIIFQPNFGYNSSTSDAYREYLYKTGADSTSWGDSHNWGDDYSVSGGLNLIYNRKFSSKKGRSLTVNLNTGFSQSNGNSWNISNKYTTDSIVLLDQYTNNTSDNFNARLRASWVEPLWNLKNMVEIAASASYNGTSSDKKQYTNTGTQDNPNYNDLLNTEYSNNIENIFLRENFELNYRYTDQSYNIMFGVNAEPSQTTNYLQYYDGRTGRDTTYGVFNISPTARIQYNMGNKRTFLRFDYRGRTQQPSINQMQPVKNNNDLMNESVGNPSLNPSFNHNIRLMYSKFNEEKLSSFSTFISANATKDALVSNRIYDNTLKQYSQTVNAKDIPLSLMWNVMYNTPVIKKRLHFNNRSWFRYNTQYSYIERGIDLESIDTDHLILGSKNQSSNYRAFEEVSLTFTHDIIELGIRGNISYSNAQNSIINTVNQTWDWSGIGNVVVNLPYKFTISSDIAYSDRSGYTGMIDQSEIMWNASVSKTLFKNKGTLSLRANDILRQRLSIRQTIGDNYISNNSYNTLPAYFMVNFTYKISSFSGMKASDMPSQDERFGPPGSGRGPSGGGFRGPREF